LCAGFFFAAACYSHASAAEFIGDAEALRIALEHAKVSEAEARRVEIERDRHRGRDSYEVEFNRGNYEYEYEIDATTGEILRWNCTFDKD
jgi:uncharacterized membrane protein YkoI